MEIQADLGSDIAMLLTNALPYPCDRKYAESSLGYTLRWARRCKTWVQEHQPCSGKGSSTTSALFKGPCARFEKRCAEELAAMDFDGYAIGGVSVGEPEEEMLGLLTIPSPGCRRTSPVMRWGWARLPSFWR